MGTTFKRAVKHEAKLRLAIAGPSGSGKTFTALTLAMALAGEAPVAVVDTERGSASKYSDLFTFDVLELETYHPDRYVEAIKAAAEAGYGVLVLDSLSHAWNGPGGLLEIVEGIAKRSKGGNSYAAWADATPIQNRLIDAITRAPLHILATMRSKTEYVQDKDERGRTTIRKVGMAPVQRDGMEYEFDILMEMDQDNTGVVQKSRCPALAGKVIAKPGADVSRVLAEWLRGAPAPPSQPVTPPAAPPAARPRAEVVPEAEPAATEQQLVSIRKLCAALGKPEPEPGLTYNGARALISQLSGEFQLRRRATEAEPAGAEAAFEAEDNGAAPPARPERRAQPGPSGPVTMAAVFQQAKDQGVNGVAWADLREACNNDAARIKERLDFLRDEATPTAAAANGRSLQGVAGADRGNH